MSENENIEAKLCSYVEGDLDAAGRAEIERYLLANPQYRPLIEQLSRTRGLLRGLPRESAPAELLETLSGQIERSALLGDEDPGSMQIRSSRFPHLAAWAAVLLLTAGLAAVIYRVLPSNKQQPELALLPPPPATSAIQSMKDELGRPLTDVDKMLASPALEAAAPAAPQAAAQAVPSVAPGAAPITTPLAATAPDHAQLAFAPPPSTQPLAEATATTSPTMASASAVVAGTVVADGTAVTNSSVMQQSAANAQLSGDATQLGQNLYVTLHAADAKAADARVAHYLNANGIPFESRSMDGQLISARPLAPLAPSSTNSFDSNDSILLPTQAAGNSNSPATGSFAAALPMEQFAKKQAPATAPSQGNALDAPSPSQAPQTAAGDVIIARNLTSDQARRLATDLNVNVLPAQLKLLPSTQPMAMDAAATGTDATLQPGESVRLVAREKLLPDIEAMNETQTIDADGNLTLPLVGKVQAAGLTASQLAQKIPQVYRDAKSPTDAVWTIDRVAATQPAGGAAPSQTQALAAAAPTPSIPATQPDGLRPAGAVSTIGGGGEGGGGNAPSGIDVTIRVVSQPAPTTALAAEPTTEPAVAPADQSPATLPTTAP